MSIDAPFSIAGLARDKSIHHLFMLIGGHVCERDLIASFFWRTQLREMAHPQDHSPRSLLGRGSFPKFSWHGGQSDAVSDYEIQLAVRPFLECRRLASGLADRSRLRNDFSPSPSEFVTPGAVLLVVALSGFQIFRCRRQGVVLRAGIAMDPMRRNVTR